MVKNYISNENIILEIICDNEIVDLLKKEYGNYYKFSEGNKKESFRIYIYINKEKYNNISNKILNTTSINELIYFKDREGIICINKKRNEIILLYQEITNNTLQFIGEIIISIFGFILEKRGYFFLHAACVEKKSKGVAIIGERQSGKTTILNILLQAKFNYISNSHLGIKNTREGITAIGAPSRMGMRIETLNILEKEIIKKVVKNTEIKQRFGRDIVKELLQYKSKKFNVKVNEIEKIYGVKLKNKADLKTIIIPLYIPGIEHMKIEKLNKFEAQEFVLRNRRNGIYDTIKHMNNIFSCTRNDVPDFSCVEIFKIYQNEKNINELVKFVDLKIEE